MSYWSQLTIQDAASPLMEQMIFFHDHIMFILILIISSVFVFTATLIFNSMTNRFLLNAPKLEIVWTLIPAGLLILLAVPSLRLLYLLDELITPAMTLKVMAHQWYWSYSYSEYPHLKFDSYMTPTSSLSPGTPRLLEVDNRATLPLNTEVRLLVSSTDVIHSWTLPVLGLKVDAIPGRLNQLTLFFTRPGIFYGQCSEICGANHSFMPIVLEIIPPTKFISLLS
uniref:Cytochrome c oxidase subunit 2 n=1 Tax=Phyllochaetopterus sp. AW-2015 TaxID=1750699 RepID=A0A0S2N0G9_9ANNE|nr:cytochrome c oxidase subunit II [Phyllochaetopterus sp. AW-2015]